MKFHTICPALEDTIRLISVNINNKVEKYKKKKKHRLIILLWKSLKIDGNYWTMKFHTICPALEETFHLIFVYINKK